MAKRRRRPRMTLERRAELFHTRGWVPVPWAHHPQPIKNALRLMRMQPQMKQCFANCQKFVVYNERLGINLDVEYREGWVQSIIPIQHAWLVFEGQIIDLTLYPREERVYLRSTGYTAEQVLQNVVATGLWTIVDEKKMHEIGPYADLLKGR